MEYRRQRATATAGLPFLLGIVAGILSISYAADDPLYLIEASAQVNSTLFAAFFNLLMAPIYVGIAIALYPLLKQHDEWLSFGFAVFRVISAVFVILGVVHLILLLELSFQYVAAVPSDETSHFVVAGTLLQRARDFTNHVAMVVSASFSGILLYLLLLKEKLVPVWLSSWGIIGSVLAIVASVLVMLRAVSVISPVYVLLNIPAGLVEIVFAVWLIAKGIRSPDEWAGAGG